MKAMEKCVDLSRNKQLVRKNAWKTVKQAHVLLHKN